MIRVWRNREKETSVLRRLKNSFASYQTARTLFAEAGRTYALRVAIAEFSRSDAMRLPTNEEAAQEPGESR